ncbi:MAG: type II CAAX endopeptidase family protein [Oscillospiraceae bacterium]
MTDLKLKSRANSIGLALVLFFASSQLLVLLANFLLSMSVKGASLQNPIGIAPWIPQLIRLFISIVSLCIPILVLRFFCKLPPPADKLSTKMPKPMVLLYSLGIFFIIVTFSGILVKCVSWVLYSGFKLEGIAPQVLPVGAFALFLVFLRSVVVPAFLEEILFRGAIQTSLLPCGERFAVITTSVLFALYHQDFSQMLGVFILSMCLGTAAVRTKSIALPIILHFANNGISFLLSVLTEHLDGTSALAFSVVLFTFYIALGLFSIYYIKTQKIKFAPLSVVKPLKNSKSRFEIMLTSPLFAVCVVLIGCIIVSRLILG